MGEKQVNNQNNYMLRETDYGPEPFVVDIHKASLHNSNFRTALWTGEHLQMTLMSIPVGGEVGLESHPYTDQYLQIESGCGCVMMGNNANRLNYQTNVYEDYAIFVPAGTWHNLVNTGDRPIKLYSIYAPPAHPHGTVHRTVAEAEADESH